MAFSFFMLKNKKNKCIYTHEITKKKKIGAVLCVKKV
jgi:hypothetical protein